MAFLRRLGPHKRGAIHSFYEGGLTPQALATTAIQTKVRPDAAGCISPGSRAQSAVP